MASEEHLSSSDVDRQSEANNSQHQESMGEGTSATRLINSIRQLTNDPRLLPPRVPTIIGKTDINWRENISENTQKIYELLLEERGEINSLSKYAKEDGFDLDSSLDELRDLNLLDENTPGIVKLTRRNT